MLPVECNTGDPGYVLSEDHGDVVPIVPPGDAYSQGPDQSAAAVAPLTSTAVIGAVSATAAVAASAIRVGPSPGCRAIRQLSVIGSWVGLLKVMYIGSDNEKPLLELENLHGYKWRPGAKARWREVRIGWQEICRVAGATSPHMSPTTLSRGYSQAAEDLDAARMKMGSRESELGFPTHLKKFIMPKHKKC